MEVYSRLSNTGQGNDTTGGGDEVEFCSENVDGYSRFSLEHSLPFTTGGVLDMKFSGSEDLLAVALSSETLSLCKVSEEIAPHECSKVVLPEEGLVLSVSWDDTCECPGTCPNVAVSTQSRSVKLFIRMLVYLVTLSIKLSSGTHFGNLHLRIVL